MAYTGEVKKSGIDLDLRNRIYKEAECRSAAISKELDTIAKGTTATPQKRSPLIEKVLVEIGITREVLEKQIVELGSRLSPIMRMSQPKDSTDENKPLECDVALANCIVRETRAIHRVSLLVEDMLDRLEI